MNPNIKKSVAALLVIAILGGMTACKKTTEPQEPERLNPSHWAVSYTHLFKTGNL